MSVKVITAPSVRLVGRLTIDEAALDHFLKDEGVEGWETDTDIAAQKLIECAGRLCYMSFANPRPGGNRAYLEHILEAGHGSVLEHSNFTFIFAGVSRSLTHELVRHRAGMAYSQLSQRYVDESDVAFVLPPAIPDDDLHRSLRIWARSCLDALDAYRALADELEDPTIQDRTARRKAAREAARSVLPNCTETKIMVTGNCRAWRNFLEQRGAEGADAEIRRLALAVLPILNAEAPAIFGDYRVEASPPGVEHITTPHRKV